MITCLLLDNKYCHQISDILPTQKVVNLLEDYGHDSRDRYPAHLSGRPAHDRTGPSVQIGRSGTRDRYCLSVYAPFIDLVVLEFKS